MTCKKMDEARLNDHVDSLLPDAERQEVDRHVRDCPDCREALEALRSLKAAAERLPRSLAPPRDLWPHIQATLNAGEAARRPFSPGLSWLWRAGWTWRAGLATAAMLVVATAITVLSIRREAAPPSMREAGRSVQTASSPTLASLKAAERDYLSVTQDLRAVLEERREELSPATVAVVEENLRIIDLAIDDITIALEKDPGHAGSRNLFTSLYWRKVMLLQQVTSLPPRS
jgi:anti-sigma-K factor RskA